MDVLNAGRRRLPSSSDMDSSSSLYQSSSWWPFFLRATAAKWAPSRPLGEGERERERERGGGGGERKESREKQNQGERGTHVSFEHTQDSQASTTH